MKLASVENISFIVVTGFYMLSIVNGLPRHTRSLDKLQVQIKAHHNSLDEFLEKRLMAVKTPSDVNNSAPETHPIVREEDKEVQARLFEWLNNIIGFGPPQEHHCSESDEEEYDDYHHHHGFDSSDPYYHDSSHAYSNSIGHFDSHEHGHHHGPHTRNVKLEIGE